MNLNLGVWNISHIHLELSVSPASAPRLAQGASGTLVPGPGVGGTEEGISKAQFYFRFCVDVLSP